MRLRNPAIPRLTLKTWLMVSTANREEALYSDAGKYNASSLFRCSANRSVLFFSVSDFHVSGFILIHANP